VSSLAARREGAFAGRGLTFVLASVGVAILVLVVLAGRWERHRWIDEQLDGMRKVQALIGPLDQPGLVGYRVLPQFDCLVYQYGKTRIALELCVDPSGRVIEAIDRHGPVWRYYSLRAEPGAATVRIDRAAVDRLLRKMHAPTGVKSS
jgi:hypothetical protein